MELMIDGWKIFHIGLSRPWNWVAKFHLKELMEENPTISNWRLRDMLYERNQEHLEYEKEMKNYFETVTIFPAAIYKNHVEAVHAATSWVSY